MFVGKSSYVCVTVCLLTYMYMYMYTCSLSLPLLQVHLLDYNEDTGVLDKTVFSHPAGTSTCSCVPIVHVQYVHVHVYVVYCTSGNAFISKFHSII